METTNYLPTNLRYLRKRAGYTCKYVATHLDLSLEDYIRYEVNTDIEIPYHYLESLGLLYSIEVIGFYEPNPEYFKIKETDFKLKGVSACDNKVSSFFKKVIHNYLAMLSA